MVLGRGDYGAIDVDEGDLMKRITEKQVAPALAEAEIRVLELLRAQP
jgi:hypothetical protein